MVFSKSFISFVVALMIVSQLESTTCVEGRPLVSLDLRRFATLGMICKCCDGVGGECRSISKGDNSCSKLECKPWKFS
ncbi:hypothetical protein GIB67_032638 [Kingdonia uniflora]|uniref:Uncharacterized protein n=1 Tax=Kingdonia uniflora TaxID=39325 RepID=A0A7J7P974_9MAGN|nr:hypothetical protein GIB67_032638 [Kingdonia uniflora]